MSVSLESQNSTAEAAASEGKSNFRIVALIVASAMLMEQLDATILATALPTMARDFNVGAPSMSVALTSYLLSLAIFIPASGKIADRFGTRTVFRFAIAIFILGSVLCAQAPNLPCLVAARLLQGAGGAMMLPVGRLVLIRSVERKDLIAAMSWMLVPALMGPILGPPLGGLFVTYLDWRWIFYINVPIGILGMIFVSLYIGEYKSETREPFDFMGLILSGIALGALLFSLETASNPEGGNLALKLFVVGIVFGVATIVHSRRHPAPMLDFSLLRIESFGTSMIAGSITRITQGAHPFLLPLMLQIGFGLSAVAAGNMVLATALGALAMKAFAPRIIRQFGFRMSLVVNGIFSACSYAICAFFTPDWPHWLIFIVLAMSGFSMSFQFTAYNTVAYDRVDAKRMSSANSFYSTFQQLMLSVGVCVAALILHASMNLHARDVPVMSDFSTAFLVVTGISLTATFWNLRFAKNAGEQMRGK
ncbi:MDR family MFS transporter [Ochrobactrum teleogrylli]|uniref:MDR family MFS transporter n=1 Tax=Ochrobactrum teleogrylli TaxID=2479765 RepID=A0ABD5JXN5_9HYPH